ncbi:MAG: HigA family addiction module antitoxin [Methylocystis sp.]
MIVQPIYGPANMVYENDIRRGRSMGRYHEELTRRFLSGVRGEAPATARRPARVRRNGVGARPQRPKLASMENGMSHPGEILARHLQDLGLTASDLARDIDVPVNRVTAIINGQRGVTADTALRLGHWFGVEPEDWLELQTQYELSLARRAAGARIKSLPSLADRRRD